MTETVKSPNERKSVFASYLEVMEAQEQQADAERQLLEDKYMKRSQRICDFHERQRSSVAELRRCCEYVAAHAHVLEAVLRGAAAGEGVPLSAALVRQAAALRQRMAHCVANATRIRQLLAGAHQPQMDTVLTKMEGELCAWTSFLQRVADSTYNTETVIDNLHNMIAEQRRCVRELSSTAVFTSLCSSAQAPAGAGAAGAGAAHPTGSPERRAPSQQACSTPLPERD